MLLNMPYLVVFTIQKKPSYIEQLIKQFKAQKPNSAKQLEAQLKNPVAYIKKSVVQIT